MNNQRRAVYSERQRVLDGRALKKQVIGYGERTMGEIVEAYVNQDLPPEEWDLDQLVGKVKEFVYLLEDLTPDQVKGLGMEELLFCRSNCVMLTTSKKVRLNSNVRFMREAAVLYPSADRYALARAFPGDGRPARSVGLRGYAKRIR